MKQLGEIRQSNVYPELADTDPSDFEHREAARAIVVDASGQVALLWVGKHGYHKLPGGGVEDGEDIAQALEREILEEIGCHAEVADELGQIVEYRDKWGQKQTSYCYVAKQVGEKGEPDFTKEELDDGFEIVWAANLDDAINLLENDKPDNYVGMFIRTRDLQFLRAAKNL
jgi:8-oxo-dGTP pyrophosphatase MutT (NUDIX family)